ncbi:hypothetical protein FJY68_09985 [candidate division WOR-3 bacterium]|uniref:Uncharacterized protein n=1 Tax=candidate division WOR-3 bacterium TaxID=2052148 RepID=A0A938BTZ4_UNCW3|nr:hypothetical protein [candidate division WOR-3 bacterium]
MRSRAVAILLAVFLVADMAFCWVCCPLIPTAVPAAGGCCGEEPTSPGCSIREDSGSAGRPGCTQGCYEAYGSSVARQGTGSSVGSHGFLATCPVADISRGENPGPSLRCSTSPSVSDRSYLAPTPRGPPVN